MFTIVRDEILKACKKYDVEFKDGVIVVKEDVDFRTLPKEVGEIVENLQNKRVPEELFSQLINPKIS